MRKALTRSPALLVIAISLVATAACTERPPIALEKIKGDLAGRDVGQGFSAWHFRADDECELSVVESPVSKDKSAVVVDVTTSRYPIRMEGRLRLNYEWVAGEWSLVTIDNLSFKDTEFLSKAKRTMADMRMIASAIGALASDEDAYPEVLTIDELSGVLSPIYLREVARTDWWGNEYKVESSEAGYELRSYGADGKLTESGFSLQFSNFDGDIVITNRGFTHHPKL